MITVMINGKEIAMQSIKQWEEKRRVHSARFLKRNVSVVQELRTAEQYLQCKMETSQACMRQALHKTLALSSFFAGVMTLASFGRRRLCVTELMIQGCCAEHLSTGFDDMMQRNTAINRKHCLAACPDHYIIRGGGNHVQEVIETAAGMPLPLQFFVTYGDEEGLCTRKDDAYPYQSAGVARLKNGRAMGGVRHQMRDVEGGCAVRLTVEFPLLMPKHYIKEHQLHLACEFTYWFQQLLTQQENG